MTKPLAEAARRLKAGELPREQQARLERAQKRAAAAALREQERRSKEQAMREKARREHALFWDAHEAAMNWRPEPPAVPVPDEPRYNLYDRPPLMNYAFRPRNGY